MGPEDSLAPLIYTGILKGYLNGRVRIIEPCLPSKGRWREMIFKINSAMMSLFKDIPYVSSNDLLIKANATS